MSHIAYNENSYTLLSAFVRAGLAEFSYQALGEETPLFKRLKKESEAVFSRSWSEIQKELGDNLSQLDGVAGQFIQENKLPLHEVFLLTLVGEMESSHLINLAVNDLQSPVDTNRPTCFLCAALVELLFSIDDYNSQDLQTSQLFLLDLIDIQGDGPLPQRDIRCAPVFWQIIQGKASFWPDCHLLKSQGETNDLAHKTQTDISELLNLLSAPVEKNLGNKSPNIILIRGKNGSGRKIAANTIAKALKLKAYTLPKKIWQTSRAFNLCSHYASWLPIVEPDLKPGENWQPRIPELSTLLIIIMGSEGGINAPNIIELNINVPDYKERLDYWQQELKSNIPVNALASARLSKSDIKSISNTARLNAQIKQSELKTDHIIQARRQHSLEKLRLLAEPINTQINRSDLALSPILSKQIKQLIKRCKTREHLADQLGHIVQATLNPGIRALFSGPSGTGKTLSASYIANQLGSPLYRVDISAIMNKYIGETEKNLSRLLDYASASDTILLFDEADSLFGRRNESEHSGERYANMITNFLLSRIESHDGIILLTSNNRQQIDTAFSRRFDAILEFSLPAYQQRYDLWMKHLGSSTQDKSETLCNFLASYCDLSGGHIRNAVLSAAIECEKEGEQAAIEVQHIITGLQSEYQKLGRSIPPSLTSLSESGNT